MRLIPSILVLVLFLGLVSVIEASAQGRTLTMVVQMTPQSGSELAFEAALRDHMEFRQIQGDTWEWNVYQTVIGDRAGSYALRSNNHAWADFDSYMEADASQAMASHFLTTVAPLAKESHSSIETSQEGLQNLPENMADMRVFAVVRAHLDASAQPQVQESLQAYHEALVEAGIHYTILFPMVGGDDGPTMTIVTLAENFAGLEEPSPSMEEILMETHGEDGVQEVVQGFLDAVESYRSSIVVLRPDLSGLDGN